MFQYSPVKVVRGDMSLKYLALKDEQHRPPVKIALFAQQANASYSKGDVLRITDVYRYTSSTEPSLSTKKSSKIEVLSYLIFFFHSIKLFLLQPLQQEHLNLFYKFQFT